MALLILDPTLERRVRAEYGLNSPDRPTEEWDGMTVVPPLPDNEYYRLSGALTTAFADVTDRDRGDLALTGGNVSDRDTGWEHNYRNPDVLVVLAGGRAVDRDTHWTGGPDLVVEIVCPGEDPHAKFGFYAGIGTREVWVVDRHPWAVELYQLRAGQLALAGRSDEQHSATIASSVLPLTVRLEAATPRPRLVLTHTRTGQVWTA